MRANIWLAAKDYVDRQLAIMRKYGSAPNLSEAEYNALVADVHATTVRLRRNARKRGKSDTKKRN